MQVDTEKEDLLVELARVQEIVTERDAELLQLNQDLTDLSERLPVSPKNAACFRLLSSMKTLHD